MSIPSFTQGYPPDNSSLGQTKATIRDNLDGTYLTLAVDHIDNTGQPGAKPAGYHKVIHMVPQAADPTPVAGYGQLYSRTITSITNDQALYWETGAGLVAQLTMNIAPSPIINGYTFLPGGILMQWGQVNNPGSGGEVTYPLPFPTAVFNIQLNYARAATTNAISFAINTSGTNNTSKFTYYSTSSGSSILYWVAIGN